MGILKKRIGILMLSGICASAGSTCNAMPPSRNRLREKLLVEQQRAEEFHMSIPMMPSLCKVKDSHYEEKLKLQFKSGIDTFLSLDDDSFFKKFGNEMQAALDDLNEKNVIACVCCSQAYLVREYCFTVQRGIELASKKDRTTDEREQLNHCIAKSKSMRSLLMATSTPNLYQKLKKWEIEKAKGCFYWSKFIVTEWDTDEQGYNLLSSEFDALFITAYELHHRYSRLPIDEEHKELALEKFQRSLYQASDISDYLEFLYRLPVLETLTERGIVPQIPKDLKKTELLLRAGSNLGCAISMERLSEAYEDGTFGEPDLLKRIYWLKKSAAYGNLYAIINLGNYYLNGNIIKQNVKKAYDCYMKVLQSPMKQLDPNEYISRIKCISPCKKLSKKKLEEFNYFVPSVDILRGQALEGLGKCYLAEPDDTQANLTESFKCFKEAANLIDDANLNLGVCYMRGEGTSVDTKKAFECFKKAATCNLRGKLFLGLCYMNGVGTSVNKKNAFRYISEAAKEGDAEAMYILGSSYCYGYFTEKNNDLAFSCYIQSASKNYSEAIYALGSCYMRGIGCEKNLDKAMEYFKIAANEFNNTTAMGMLGTYYSIVDVPKDKKDLEQAIKYLFIAANAESLPAIVSLGFLYTIGVEDILPVDMDRAIELFKKSANIGHSSSMVWLGNHYLNTHSFDEAIKYYKLAMQAGNALGKYYLGYCSECGYGCERDVNLAFRLYNEVANTKEAKSRLGYCYMFGIGCKPDMSSAKKFLEDAVKDEDVNAMSLLADVYIMEDLKDKNYIFNLYKKAAEKNIISAMYSLAYLYAHGIGVEKDESQAGYWYDAAIQSEKEIHNNILSIYCDCGIGIACDDTRKIEWLQEAATLGNNNAMYELGTCFGKCDLEKSFEWYKKAAENGHISAAYELIKVYVARKDISQAEIWFNRLREEAKQGNFEANYYLGLCFENGVVVDKNLKTALDYYKKAVLKCTNATNKDKEQLDYSQPNLMSQIEFTKKIYEHITGNSIIKYHQTDNPAPIIDQKDIEESELKRNNKIVGIKSEQQNPPYTVRYWNTAVQADAKKNLDTTCEWGRNLDMLSHEQKAAYTTKLLAKLKGNPLVSIEGKDLFDLIGEKKLNYTLYEARLNNAQGEKDGSVIIYGVDEENKEIVIFYIGPRFGAQHKNEISINLEAEEKGVLATSDDDKKTC